MTKNRTPRTEAGRALLDDATRFGTAEEVGLLREHLLPMLLAIEAEAAMNGWNQHVEAIGEPERAAFMEGYNHRKEEEAEAATAERERAERLEAALRDLVSAADSVDMFIAGDATRFQSAFGAARAALSGEPTDD